MSVNESGRRPIEDTLPMLQGRTCVISIGLRKEWAKKPSYWIELFAKPLGPQKRSHLLTMARQWSFYRQTTKEQIEDQYVMPNEWTSVNNAVSSILDYVKARVEDKDEIISCITHESEWADVALDLKTKLMAKEPRRGQGGGGKLPSKEKTIAEKFAETAAEREKKANW